MTPCGRSCHSLFASPQANFGQLVSPYGFSLMALDVWKE
ncbi:hypothetical protein TNCV_2105371, partial [Trichonephila clavipes]